MRLFIALSFDKSFCASVMRTADSLARFMRRSRRTPQKNLHLTLAFLGEQPPASLEELKAAMCAVKARPFVLKTAGIGVFRRSGGDIWWLGFEPSAELDALQAALVDGLAERGFETERRVFRPHMTLLRSAVEKEGVKPFVRVPHLTQRISAIRLIESRLSPDGAEYRELFVHRLNNYNTSEQK